LNHNSHDCSEEKDIFPSRVTADEEHPPKNFISFKLSKGKK